LRITASITLFLSLQLASLLLLQLLQSLAAFCSLRSAVDVIPPSSYSQYCCVTGKCYVDGILIFKKVNAVLYAM